MVGRYAGDVPDVFASLTHSQICVHGPFKTVEINRGRHAMRALGERSVDLLITMNTHGRYPDCRRDEVRPAFSVLAHPCKLHIEVRALVVHPWPAIRGKRFRFRNCLSPFPELSSRRSIQCKPRLSQQRSLQRCGS